MKALRAQDLPLGWRQHKAQWRNVTQCRRKVVVSANALLQSIQIATEQYAPCLKVRIGCGGAPLILPALQGVKRTFNELGLHRKPTNRGAMKNLREGVKLFL